jgi:hypothetical protein
MESHLVKKHLDKIKLLKIDLPHSGDSSKLTLQTSMTHIILIFSISKTILG